ncbi:hypothetical protein I6G56_26480 [Burkholderia humptydooensis]|uniref:Tail fiber protein n=2 Tax=Burkholderia humptydooensis TaxID=430531 RepID=A0A7T2U4V4_9BURK|nr:MULTISPECIES: hypothetical protein [Burkholderia]AJY39349.1 putative fels-2 prophage Pin [Burkholderia sp. 2002721687]QPS45691.1 hypothetical protein I6G56_26480 [Burkholderia humptydooensis]
MATNDFLVFGGGSSPNVIDQATYAALAARLSGFVSGTAQSQQLNKVWRQSSIMAAVLAQFTANYSGQNSVDDGTTATLLANLVVALNAAGITAGQFDNSTKQATTAFVQRALGNFQAFYSFNTTPQNLTASLAGSFIVYFGSSAGTFNLPAESAVPAGGAFFIQNISSASLTINRAGTDTIIVGSSTVTSLTLGPGDSVLLTGVNNSSQWTAAGIAQLPYAAVMSGPNFTTAAQFDSSTRLATTAFVQRALGSFSGIKLVQSTNTTLDATAFGTAIQISGSSCTITLPSGNGAQPGSTIRFYAQGAAGATYTIKAVGGAFIYAPGAGMGSSNTTLTLNNNDTVELTNRSGNEWDVTGGSWIISNEAVTLGPNATGTTAASGDNSTKLATTAYVQANVNAGRLLNVQTFTSSSTYTNTPGTNKIRVRGRGTGGGSAGVPSTSSTQVAAAGGGGGGPYIDVWFTSGFTGGVPVTIGAPGTAGAAGLNNGGNGGTSTFGSLVTLPGGVGSAATAAGVPPLIAGAGTISSPPTATGGIILDSAVGGPGSVGQVFASGAGVGGDGGASGDGRPGPGGRIQGQPGTPAQSSGTGASGGSQGNTGGALSGGAGGNAYFIVEEWS